MHMLDKMRILSFTETKLWIHVYIEMNPHFGKKIA